MPQCGGDFKVRTGEQQVVHALGSIGSATLLSRVLGFARDMLVALTFGAGPLTDAFFVAFRIPNILRRLLAEGALATAIIPVFSEYFVRSSRSEARRMLRAVLALALLALGVTTLLGMLGTPLLLRAIAPGFAGEPERWALAVRLTRVMFPYLILVGLAALATGALNAHGRFFASALGPAVLNLGMIAAVALLARRVDPAILSLAIGVLVGGLGQLLVQVPSLHRLGLLVGPSAELSHPSLPRIARLLLPAVFGLAAVQVMVLVNTLLASLLAPGAISFLYYADRVMEFPLGVFGIALASASLPLMARQAAEARLEAIAGTLNFSLRLATYVAVPASVGLVLLREPIIRVLFQHGRFGEAETAATAAALAWYAAGLVGFSAARIVAQALYAVGQAGTAVRWGVVAVAANVVAAIALMGPLGHAGLAGASSVGAYVHLVGLLWAARRRLGPLGGRGLVASVARTSMACAPLGAWCVLAIAWWPGAPGSGWTDVALLAVTVSTGAVVFWASTVLLRAPERLDLLRVVPWRRQRE